MQLKNGDTDREKRMGGAERFRPLFPSFFSEEWDQAELSRSYLWVIK